MMENKDIFKLEQVAIRMVQAPPLYSAEQLDSPSKIVNLFAQELADYDREVMVVVNLKTNLQPINFNICSMGALDAAIAHPRELLKSVFLSNAHGICLIHNHPSGSLEPSREDIRLTGRMQDLCQLSDIELVDHIIIGSNSKQFYSFRQNEKLSLENRLSFKDTVEELSWERVPNRREEKKDKLHDIAERIDKFGYEYNIYNYRNTPGKRADRVEHTYADLKVSNTKEYENLFLDIMEDYPDLKKEANEILSELQNVGKSKVSEKKQKQYITLKI